MLNPEARMAAAFDPSHVSNIPKVSLQKNFALDIFFYSWDRGAARDQSA